MPTSLAVQQQQIRDAQLRRLEQQRILEQQRADAERAAQQTPAQPVVQPRDDFRPARVDGPVALDGHPAGPETPPPAVDTEKVDDAEDLVLAGDDGTELVEQLRGDDLNESEKRDLVSRIVNGDDPARYLTNFDELGEERNYDYDDQALVSTAIADAYRNGDITDYQLQGFVERLGPDEASRFAGQLALDPNNTRAGGIVEAFGRAAQAGGDERTAALAFSSSQELIDRNLPSDTQQAAAFDEVRGWVEGQDRDDFSNEQQADFTIASANALRLSANGNGYSEEEATDFLEDLGPSLAGEIVSRARNTPGDSGVDGTVDLIGRAAKTLEGRTDGDDQEEWRLDSAVAFSASPELIDARLSSPSDAAAAFATLTAAADDQYDTAQDADGEYNLVRFPEITEGAAALFANRTDDIVSASLASRDGLSPDTLQTFAENVAFSPYTSSEVKTQVRDTLTDWSKEHLGTGTEADAYQHSLEVGQVLGIMQNGADAAVDRVGDDEAARVQAENDAKNFFIDVGSKVFGGAVTLGLSNPVAGGAATGLSSELLQQVFPDQDVEQARVDAENNFREQLEQDGTSADLGQAIEQARREQIGRAQGRINYLLAHEPNLSAEDRENLQNLSLALQTERNGIDDGYTRARPR